MHLISGGIAALFFIINLHALSIDFLPIDDHEIISASPSPLHWWLHSEAFNPWLRWRPLYYSIRSIEAFLWGNNSFAWHLFRLASVALAIYLLTLSSAIIMGLASGALFGLSLLFAPSLTHLVQLLGPAELYCLIGLSLWAYGCTKLLIKFESHERIDSPRKYQSAKEENLFIYSVFIFIGSVMAAGSKETLLILLAPNSWILYQSIRLSRYLKLGRSIVLLIAMSVVSMVPMIVFVGRLYVNSGKDIYGKSLTPTGGEILKHIISSFHAPGLLVVCMALMTLGWSLTANRELDVKTRILLFLILINFWSVYVNRESVIFAHFFRYALLHQLGILGMAWILVSYWTNDLSKWGQKFKKLILISLSGFILLIGSLFAYISHGLSIRLATDSHRWKKFIYESVRTHNDTGLPVTIVAQSATNCHEHCASAALFLELLGNISENQINILIINSEKLSTTNVIPPQLGQIRHVLTSNNSVDKNSLQKNGQGGKSAKKNYSPFSSGSFTLTHATICILPIEDANLEARLIHQCEKVISYRGQHFHRVPWINRLPFQLTKLISL